MVEAITAAYVQEDADWTITVSGRGKRLTGRAPGIIAARDRADQLVEELASESKATVVHLLNGSALEFTSTYMAARLTLPKFPPLEIPPAGSSSPAASKGSKGSAPKAKPALPGKQLPKEVDGPKDAKSAAEPKAKKPAKAATPPAARTS